MYYIGLDGHKRKISYGLKHGTWPGAPPGGLFEPGSWLLVYIPLTVLGVKREHLSILLQSRAIPSSLTMSLSRRIFSCIIEERLPRIRTRT